jgi:hypothetical protein
MVDSDYESGIIKNPILGNYRIEKITPNVARISQDFALVYSVGFSLDI